MCLRSEYVSSFVFQVCIIFFFLLLGCSGDVDSGRGKNEMKAAAVQYEAMMIVMIVANHISHVS